MMLFRAALLAQIVQAAAPDHIPEFLLVACAKVAYEDTHLIEWIEFHRLQGFDKFVLYTEAPANDRRASLAASHLSLLPEFYAQRGFPDLVEVVPLGPLLSEMFGPQAHLNETYSDWHRTGQNTANLDCLRRFEDLAEWIAMFDPDEFLWMVDPSTRATVAEYLFVIGHQYYSRVLEDDEPYPLSGSPLHGIDPEPAVLQIFTSLFDQNATEWMHYLQNQTLVGLFAPSQPYGAAGVFWSHKHYLQRDPISGIISLFFDPRDDVRFNATWSSLSADEKTYFTRPDEVAAMDVQLITRLREKALPRWSTREWDEHASLDRLEFLQEASLSNLLESDQQAIFDFLTDRLRRDYGSEKTPLMAPWPEIGSSRLQKALQVRLDLGRKHLGSLDRELLLDDFMEAYSSYWSEAYPLVTEQAVWRMPSSTMGDELNDIYDAIEKSYPECSEYLREVRAIDETYTETDPYAEPPPPQMPLPHIMCKVGRLGPDYLDTTLVGKTMYWTGELVRREQRRGIRSVDDMRHLRLWTAFRRSFDVEGCRSPWIHYCATRTSLEFPGTISRFNPLYEIRLDHHSTRSFMKRSFEYHGWRKDHTLGFMAARKGSVLRWEAFMNSVYDPGKRFKFGKSLRQAMQRLFPIPRFGEYSFEGELGGVTRLNEGNVCTVGELLAEIRVQCPRDFPKVGLSMAREIHPPSPVLVGGYCVNPTTESEIRSLDSLSGYLETPISELTMCPGWPETSCCDREGESIDKYIAYTGRNTSISQWLGASVCLGCRG